MKKIIYLSILILFVSCTKSPLQEAVEKKITKDGFGVDLSTKFKNFEIIDTVTVKTLIDNWYKVNGENLKKDSIKPSIAETIKRLKWLFGNSDLVGMSKKESDDDILAYQYKLDRIKYLEKKNPNAIEYYVVKAEYVIKNPLVNNMKFNQNKIFFISKKYDKFLGKDVYEGILSEDMDTYKKIEDQFKSDKITRYETMLFMDKNKIKLDEIEEIVQK